MSKAIATAVLGVIGGLLGIVGGLVGFLLWWINTLFMPIPEEYAAFILPKTMEFALAGIFFGFLGVIGGALAFVNLRRAGLLMIVSAAGGLVTVLALYSAGAFLLTIASLLAFGKLPFFR